MRIERILLGLLMAAVLCAGPAWSTGFGDGSSIALDDDNGIKSDDASGTTLSGVVTGVAVTAVDDAGVAVPVDAKLAMVTTLKSGKQEATFGDLLVCPAVMASGPNCATICLDGSGPKTSVDLTETVGLALCLEERLGGRVAAAFGKSSARVKVFDFPVEDADASQVPGEDGLYRAYFATNAEVSAK